VTQPNREYLNKRPDIPKNRSREGYENPFFSSPWFFRSVDELAAIGSGF
jgi:hypothetical protein